MKRFILLTAVFSLLICNVAFSQSRSENKKKFYEAEGYVLFEEYEDALTLYLELIKSYPDNVNLKYRIGECYVNIPAEREKSLPWLEEAVKNINPKYREGRFRETKAPYDAYYYLANAYRINNQLDKATETYELFNKNLDTRVYNPEVVKMQIESCINAKELMKAPLYIRKQNLGNVINDEHPDRNPVVSGDQKSMVYNRLTPFQEALFYVRKVNGIWSNPVNIIPDLGLGQEEGNFATSLSKDGKELYIYRRGNDYDGNIYVTKLQANNRWSNIVKLNDNINTKYWESHATISHDGKKLYFTSNRKDSRGGLDIYMSERDTGNTWGPAVNLGPVINTEYNEDTPFLSDDDRTLFFSSAGHYNMGGYDIFYSTLLDNGEWSVPLNAGYPLNTTDDDLFFHPLGKGYEAYYSLISDGGYGLSDIYSIEIFSDNHPRKFIVKGVAKIEGLVSTPDDKVRVKSSSTKYPDRTVTAFTDAISGEYEFQADHGDYVITFDAPNARMITQDLNLALDAVSDTITVPGVVLPKTDLVADLKVEETKSDRNTMGYMVTTEPASVLVVEKWAGDSLVSSEQFAVSDREFEYKTKRSDEVNKLTFRVTDRYSNIAAVDVPVVAPLPVRVKPPVTGTLVARKEPPKPVEKPAEPVIDTARKVPPVSPVQPVAPVSGTGKGCRLWYLWLLPVLGVVFFLIILWRRRKRDKKPKE